jgi:D-glycero-alpha-D-manno-heptose-7-phosphate kinase
MMFQKLDKIIFSFDKTLRTALESLNETAEITDSKGFAIIVDKNGRAIGVLSDGDIRRKLLANVTLDDPVSAAMETDYISVSKKHTIHQILRLFDSRVSHIPLIDEDGRPIDLFCYSQFRAPMYSVPRIIRARVPVRVSFSGGGTDMSHHMNSQPSFIFSSTINKYSTATILPREDGHIHITSKDLDQSCESSSLDELRYDGKLDLLKAAIKVMQPNFGFNLETLSDVEVGTGLGGSSAMVVAVIGALNHFRNENQLDLYHIADLAYQAERIELGIEGGWQDQYTTTFGGFNWVEFRQNDVVVQQLRLQREILLELEYNMMLFRIGGSHDSGNIQKEMIERTKFTEPELHLQDMINLSVQMKETLLKGEVKKFGDLLHKAWEIKKASNQSVSTPIIDQCYDAARESGALGGKLLGAGQCGYMIIYASPIYHVRIMEDFLEFGCHREPLRFTENGLEVWSAIR